VERTDIEEKNLQIPLAVVTFEYVLEDSSAAMKMFCVSRSNGSNS
jgi:hypothetical protein